MSHNEDKIILLQYGAIEQKIVLRDSEENGIMKYSFKLELVNEAEKVVDIKQYSIVEI